MDFSMPVNNNAWARPMRLSEADVPAPATRQRLDAFSISFSALDFPSHFPLPLKK